tara:strand:+ start:18436 stop:19455 length:1020 start_codon:yes stop_codon:yes gene_type:complete
LSSIKTITKNTKFKPVDYWAKIPHGIWMREATSVAVDKDDNVYVFNRGNQPVLIFDTNGNLLNMWGNDNLDNNIRIITDSYGNSMQFWKTWFTRPHSITIDHENNIWLVDDSGNQIHKMSKEGKNLLTIGDGKKAPAQSGNMFNQPTDVVVSKTTNEIFISDGYGNSRIHKLDKNGNLIKSWGKPGTDPGEFNLPHNLALIDDKEVIVCDRESNRIQIFDTEGNYIRQWFVHKAVAVEVIGSGENARLFIAEQGPTTGSPQRGVENVGNRIGIYDRYGNRINRIGSKKFGEHSDGFLWPHSLAIDSMGSIYIAEVSYTEWGKYQNPKKEMISLRKWIII